MTCASDIGKQNRTGLEPTARGDMRAELMRRWYEKNRESAWDRIRPGAPRKSMVADNFMIGMLDEAKNILGLDDEALTREWMDGP